MPQSLVEARTFNPFAQPDFMENPWVHYERLREADPLHFSEGLGWIAVDYEDCRALLNGQDTRQADPSEWQPDLGLAGIEELQGTVREWIGMSNPPHHRRRRGLIEKAFAAQSVRGMQHIVDRCIDELLGKALRDGGMDFVAGFAFPLPANVICSLLGVPDSDRDLVRQWSDDVSKTYDPNPNEARLRKGIAAAQECQRYFQAAITERQRQPREDLLTGFAQAQEKGDSLSPHEIAANALLVFLAGHETTSAVISNGALELYRAANDDQREILHRERPAIYPAAVEEIMRHGGSVHTIWRVADHDFECAGRRIKENDLIVVCLAAGNRDPKCFPEPNRFDIQRARPKQQLGFGWGPHLCIGRTLARLEIETAFNVLLDRAPGMHLLDEHPPYGDHISSRGPATMPVKF